MAGNRNLERALLVTDGTLGTDGLHVQCIFAAGEVAEGDTVCQSVTVAPVFILAFHPVHKLQAFALVVVTGCELDGECILVVSQFKSVGLVEGLWQHDALLVHMTCQDLLLADEQLGEHHAWKGVGVVVALLHHPVHTVETAQQHVAVLLGDDGTGIELVALQTVNRCVVVEAVVVSSFFVVALHNDTAHTAAGGHPDVVVLVFCDTADVVIAQTLLLRQVVQRVVLKVQDVQTFTRTDPEKSSGVLYHLRDKVVRERLQIRLVTSEHCPFRCREVQDKQSFSRSYIKVVGLSVLVVEQAGDVVCRQFAVLTGVRGERVHLGIVHLHTAVGGDPQVTDLIRAEGVDMVVDEGGGTVRRQRVDLRHAVLHTGQTVALRTDPEAAVLGGGETRYLHTGQIAFVADDTLVAGTIPDGTVGILCDGCDVAQVTGTETVDILSAVGNARLLRTYPQQVGIIHIDTLDADLVDLSGIHIDVTWLDALHTMCVDVHFQQSELVRTDPDVT